MRLTQRFTGMLIAVMVFAMQAQGVIFENTSHEMASGDFFGDGRNEVAYIRGDGSIFIHDFQQNTGKSTEFFLPPSQTAVKLVAADVNGDGRDDLAVVSSQNLSLITFDVLTNSIINNNSGSNIQDISSANIDLDAVTEIMVTNTSNNIFTFQNGGFVNVGGAGSALASGEFNGDATEEFLVTGGNTPGAGQGLFFFDGEANGFGVVQGGGGGINRIAAGNLNPSDATDEVYLTNTGGTPFATDGAGYIGTGGNGSDIGIGELAALGGQERAYIIGGGGAIFQSSLAWGSGAFNAGYQFLLQDQSNDGSLQVGMNSGFTDFIVADIDNDGLDEIIARKGGDELFIFENGDAAFALATPGITIPEPATATLGLLGLAGLLSRRRRAA